MKKFLLLLLLSVSFVNCNLPNYVLTNKAQTIGVDFSKGKWLLNDIDAPNNVVERLTQLAKKDFEEILKDRFIIKNNAKGILLSNIVSLSPSKKELEDLKNGTNFDFFINIKASNNRDDFGSIDITPKPLNIDRQNSSEIILEIYDLNTLEIIYSQKAIGSTRMLDNNSDVNFSKSSKELQLGAYKKLIKELKKKSIQ